MAKKSYGRAIQWIVPPNQRVDKIPGSHLAALCQGIRRAGFKLHEVDLYFEVKEEPEMTLLHLHTPKETIAILAWYGERDE